MLYFFKIIFFIICLLIIFNLIDQLPTDLLMDIRV